jgi:hypothetical protein|tara:strand:- start:7744 stop:7971 length:228 start_codon:yes stop_codon:yes gene_type:complete
MANKKKKDKKKKEWIGDAIERPGTFTAKAKKKGITSAQLQENVLSNPDDYDEKTVKQANLRKTLVRVNKNKKSKK